MGMRSIEKKLSEIEKIIVNNLEYDGLENNRLELKDLSGGGDWKELYKTVCAFLNSGGGVVIIGVKEDGKTKKLKFTGYNQNNEAKIKDLARQFTGKNNKALDLSQYVSPGSMEIHPLLKGQVCVLYIEKLPEEEKFVYYNGNAYERQLSGGHIIAADKIKKQAELREELLSSKETETIDDSTIDDLDIDKLNDFIIRLNAEKKIESLKADIQSAAQFLKWKRMLRDGKPTVLGMLVCGKRNPLEYYLRERCELDAYFENGKTGVIADDRKIYKENIIDLMEAAWAFVFSKTDTGLSVSGGGSAVFEYPEEIIRETINNALAHRDYTVNRFSTIIVRNNENIEIRNPGSFRQEQLFQSDRPVKIRRIIPFPKPRNPNLADILKIYRKWEGRGIGMSSLVNCALNNEIDVPYYVVHNQYEVSLCVQKGRILDDRCEMWLNSFSGYISGKTEGIPLTEAQKTVLAYFYKSEILNAGEKYTINFSMSNNHFNIINELELYGLIHKLPADNLDIQLYGVDETLKKDNYNNVLSGIFGKSFYSLDADSIAVLNAIYQYNTYSVVTEVSARLAANYLFFYKTPRIGTSFDNYTRKIRRLVNRLERDSFLKRKTGGKTGYTINSDYPADAPSL
jgi:predicted HTH transcriptional regulator